MADVKHQITIRISREGGGRYFASFSRSAWTKPEVFFGRSPIAAIRKGLDKIEHASANQKLNGQGKLKGRPLPGWSLRSLTDLDE